MNNFALLHLNDIISLRKKMTLFQIAMLVDSFQPLAENVPLTSD